MIRHVLPFSVMVAAACAETTAIPFKQPEGFPLKFRLMLPKQAATVLNHKPVDGFDVITARIDDEQSGTMVVEGINGKGKSVWHHDFGYNSSATPGCSVSISFHPKLEALIVAYQGYKWDHDHKLLFVERKKTGNVVREYSNEAPEIASFLKKQAGYSADHKYSIRPMGFIKERIEFECIPLERPELKSVHPFAQDVSWFYVTAALGADFKISPLEAKTSH